MNGNNHTVFLLFTDSKPMTFVGISFPASIKASGYPSDDPAWGWWMSD